jgi:hypothetical protein
MVLSSLGDLSVQEIFESASHKLEAGQHRKRYGAAEAGDSKGSERKPASVSLIISCLVAPVLIFVITYYMMSFFVRYWSCYLAYFVVALTLLVSLSFGGMAYGARGKGGVYFWQGLAFFLSLIAWGWAVFDGNNNFQNFMQPYFDLQQLNVYKGVDPSSSGGNQYMDFAIMDFVNEAAVEPRYAMAFKNRETYCAAPIKLNGTDPESYDFWAVGMNCCTSRYDFSCGPKHARSGLRVARESQRSFYELTVRQAAASYNLRVSNPVYLQMVDDPAREIDAYRDDAYRTFIHAAFYFVCVEVGLVVVAAFTFSKM